MDNKLIFPNGIFGFGELREFILVDSADDDLFFWLMSCDDKNLCWPLAYIDGHFCVVTIPGDLLMMTANTKAPIIIHGETRIGGQMLLTGPLHDERQIRKPIFELFKSGKLKKNQKIAEQPFITKMETLPWQPKRN